MSVNLDKRPILNTFYRQKVWENKVTIPTHKQNFFNAFVRFSWCFEGKSGICLVVYNLHLWGSRDALKGKVEYVWSYTTYICEVLVMLWREKWNMFGRIQPTFVRFSWCFEGKSGICLVVYNLHLWGSRDALKGKMEYVWSYTTYICEVLVMLWREKWNMFGRIQPTFVRFSWCFEGKSGICLVVYNLHLWGSRDALKGKVEYVWSYTTYICEVLVMLWREKWNMFGRIQPTFVRFSWCFEGKNGICLVVYNLHLWGSRDALKGKVEYVWSYTTYICEVLVMLWREKWNMFGRIQPTFVRFSWCFEGKSGICLVVYNLHLWGSRDALKGKVEYVWSYTTYICEVLVMLWREKWNMFGRIQPTFVRFSWCFEGKSGICLVVYNLHLWGSRDALKGEVEYVWSYTTYICEVLVMLWMEKWKMFGRIQPTFVRFSWCFEGKSGRCLAYTTYICEVLVMLWREKWNMFGRIQPTFVRFSWCFEGNSGICLVVYNLHLWGSRDALKGKVEYVWSYTTYICEVLVMLWREKWNMFGRIQPTFVRFSWCFEGKSGICLVVYNLHLWGSRDALKGEVEYVWSYTTYICEVLVMLWREKWNMFGRIQPTFDYNDTFLSQECKNG